MTCRDFEDSMVEHFAASDDVWLREVVVRERWNDLTASPNHDHLAVCSDCQQSLLQFLRTRGSVDYNLHPCFHVAFYSAEVPERCLDKQHGMYVIITDPSKRGGIVIGFCPWCGTALPTSPA